MDAASDEQPDLGLELRADLVTSGGAEEMVKILASLLENGHSLDGADTFEARCGKVSVTNAPHGKFGEQLPEVVKGRSDGKDTEALAQEKTTLRNRIAEMEATLAASEQTLAERGFVELAAIRLSNVRCEHIPDMDPGTNSTGASDPYLLATVHANATHEWRSYTEAVANVESACSWDEVPELKVNASSQAKYVLHISLWDNDVTNSDDCMGTATVHLEGRSGSISAQSLKMGKRAKRTTEISEVGTEPVPCVSFDWQITGAGFDLPPETVPIAAQVNIE